MTTKAKTVTKKPAVKKAVKKSPAKKKSAAKATKTFTFKKSEKMFDRAAKVIPGGIYGHQSPALTVPGAFPYYSAKARGSHYWDIDGNEVIDYICAWGPMVVGYNNPAVEKAVDKQRAIAAGITNHPTEMQIKLAEKMVSLVPFADWAVFAKNGGDITTWATMVAREHTKRKKILMCRGGYHGVHAWNTPGHNGVIDEDREHVHLFSWNDLDGLRSLAKKHSGQVACIILTPYHHPAFSDSVLPADGFWAGVRKLCDEEGIVLILDDVRAGFRLDIEGSQKYFGFEPDISCYCKAIANGYSISCGVGREELRISASKLFWTGSYWNSAYEMAAALATIETIEKTDGIATMFKMGQMLMDGLNDLGQKHGFPVKTTGPAPIPYVRFEDPDDFYLRQKWCAEVSKRGSFFHPHHNWFLSTAHTAKDIATTLNHADDAFKVIKKKR
jgi:glutamate-1-semialdehyde 2,1-aminomutase